MYKAAYFRWSPSILTSHKALGNYFVRQCFSSVAKFARPFSDGNDGFSTKCTSTKDARIIWVDCEMTGLDVTKDHLLEVACLITEEDLSLVEPYGLSIVIHQPDEVLNSMNKWCIKQHEKSGLTKAVRSSKISLKEAELQLLNYVRRYVDMQICPLAGNCVFTDSDFLCRHMPSFEGYFGDRIIDVDSIEELCIRWNIPVHRMMSKNKSAHRALKDVKDSIKHSEKEMSETLAKITSTIERLNSSFSAVNQRDERKIRELLTESSLLLKDSDALLFLFQTKGEVDQCGTLWLDLADFIVGLLNAIKMPDFSLSVDHVLCIFIHQFCSVILCIWRVFQGGLEDTNQSDSRSALIFQKTDDVIAIFAKRFMKSLCAPLRPSDVDVQHMCFAYNKLTALADKYFAVDPWLSFEVLESVCNFLCICKEALRDTVELFPVLQFMCGTIFVALSRFSIDRNCIEVAEWESTFKLCRGVLSLLINLINDFAVCFNKPASDRLLLFSVQLIKFQISMAAEVQNKQSKFARVLHSSCSKFWDAVGVIASCLLRDNNFLTVLLEAGLDQQDLPHLVIYCYLIEAFIKRLPAFRAKFIKSGSHALIDKVLACISACSSDTFSSNLLLRFPMPASANGSPRDASLYEFLLIRVQTILTTCSSQAEFYAIELSLFMNIDHPRSVGAQLVADALCYTARFTNEEIRFTFAKRLGGVLLKSTDCYDSRTMKFGHLFQRLCGFLTKDQVKNLYSILLLPIVEKSVAENGGSCLQLLLRPICCFLSANFWLFCESQLISELKALQMQQKQNDGGLKSIPLIQLNNILSVVKNFNDCLQCNAAAVEIVGGLLASLWRLCNKLSQDCCSNDTDIQRFVALLFLVSANYKLKSETVKLTLGIAAELPALTKDLGFATVCFVNAVSCPAHILIHILVKLLTCPEVHIVSKAIPVFRKFSQTALVDDVKKLLRVLPSERSELLKQTLTFLKENEALSVTEKFAKVELTL